MHFSKVSFALVSLLSWIPLASLATGPTVIDCGKKGSPAQISISAEAWTSIDDQGQLNCPLLEDKQLLRLVKRSGPGTIFAHPAIPGTCLSGTVTEGTLTFEDGDSITIDPAYSYTESAQRLFPAPQGSVNSPLPPGSPVNLFAGSADGTLQAGAAMTAVHIEGQDDDDYYSFDILLDDKFLVTATGEDTEDFLVVGSRGDFKVTGRIVGRGQIISQEPLGIVFEINGSVCLK